MIYLFSYINHSLISISGMADQTEETPKDMFSDFENPKAVRFEEITAAAFMIQSGITKTPIMVFINLCFLTSFVTRSLLSRCLI